MIESNKLAEEIEKMKQVHQRAEQVFINENNIPSDLMREYKGKISQYEDMYSSIETMKSEVSSEDTIEKLINQQISVLQTRIKFEIDIIKRALS